MELRHLVDDVKLEIYPGTMRYFIGCPISTKGKTPEQVKDEARGNFLTPPKKVKLFRCYDSRLRTHWKRHKGVRRRQENTVISGIFVLNK